MTKANVKKSLFTCAVAFMAVVAASVGLLVKTTNAKAAALTETVSYTADFSNGMPEDWRTYKRSALSTAVEDATPTDGKLTVGNTVSTTGANTYYGSVYRVAQSLGNVSDFTAELTFTIKEKTDDSRWLALMYRTQTTWHGKLVGYGMSYRPMQGRSYEVVSNYIAEDDYQTTSAVVNFNDGTSLYKYENGTPIPTVTAGDGVEHTLKVVAVGETAMHYIDDVLVETISLADDPSDDTDVFSRLGGYHPNGGFELVVAGMTVDITSFTISNAVRDKAVESYVADFDSFNEEGLPDNWELDAYGEIDYATTYGDPKAKKATVVNYQDATVASVAEYYGTKIDLNIGNYSDFVFEMTFKMNSYVNVDRWLGILYHTQTDIEGWTSGYLQNYRVSGKNAMAVVTGNRGVSFSADFNIVDATTATSRYLPELTSGEHTIRIWATGDTVYTYMDDRHLSSLTISAQSPVLTEGGFSILVNRSTIEVSKLFVVGTKVSESKRVDLEFAPSVVMDVDFADDFSALTKRNADSAIFTVDGDLNALAADGSVIKSLEDAIAETSAYALPIVRLNGNKENTMNKSADAACRDYDLSDAVAVEDRLLKYISAEDKAAADALLQMLSNTGLTDISVMSNDKVLLYYIRRNNDSVRGILDWSEQDLTKADWQYVVSTTNMSWAHIAVLNERSATREAVEFIQGRLKTVWIEQESYTTFNTSALVSTGCYGIVTTDVATVRSAYELYADDLKSLVRAPMNIAHRGISNVAENSLAGYQAAYSAGSIYFEIDAWLTADKEVVLMHNEWISYTTNVDELYYAGKAPYIDYKVTETNYWGVLENYKINRAVDDSLLADEADYQPIPRIVDFFNYFWDKDIVYAFEIKDGNKEIVYKIRELIEAQHEANKDKEGYVNIWQQIFFITFNKDILATLRDVIPEIPTAYLSDGTNETCAQLNCVEDLSGGNRAHTEYSKKRGYMSYCWTYNAFNTDDAYVYFGTYGITTNYAQTLTNNARFLDPIASGGYVDGVSALENGYQMNFVSENRSTPVLKPTTASLHALEEAADGKSFSAIFKAQTATEKESIPYTLYSEAVDFYKLLVDYDSSCVKVVGSAINKYYQEGTPVSLTVSSIGENCMIKSITINGNTMPVNDEEMTLSFKMDEVKDVSVEYEKKYAVSVSAENGRLTIVSPTTDGYYVKGTMLTVRVAADDGYRIGAVKLNGSTAVLEADGTLVFEVTSKTTITLETVKMYNLTVSNGENGSFSGVENKAYDEGTTLTIAVTPNNGYRVSRFEINGYEVELDENGEYVFVMNLDLNVCIEYEKIPNEGSSSGEGGGGCFATSSASFVALTLCVVACGYAIVLKKRKQS